MIDATTVLTYATVVLGLFLIPGPAVLLTLSTIEVWSFGVIRPWHAQRRAVVG